MRAVWRGMAFRRSLPEGCRQTLIMGGGRLSEARILWVLTVRGLYKDRSRWCCSKGSGGLHFYPFSFLMGFEIYIGFLFLFLSLSSFSFGNKSGSTGGLNWRPLFLLCNESIVGSCFFHALFLFL